MSNPSPNKASMFILPRTDPTTGKPFVTSHKTFRVITDRIGDSVKVTWKRLWFNEPYKYQVEYVLNEMYVVEYMRRVNPDMEFDDDIPFGYWTW